MGLDMYLYRKSYVENWDHTPLDRRHEITVKFGGEVCTDIKPERISYIVEKVAYWRKANAIHRWFVEHCQGGVDDCREAIVGCDNISELVNLCKRVLGTIETVEGDVSTGTTYYPDGRVVENTKPGEVVAQKAIAAATLPTQPGFFFGNTEYNEYYLDDLRRTVEQLEPFIGDDRAEFYYSSSW